MAATVVFSPEAEKQLAELYRYIAEVSSSDTAARYTEAIVVYCESLRTLPRRGTRRDDIRSGLRITNFRKRVVIAFSVDQEQIAILGIFYGGRNYEIAMQDEAEL
ncbi:hypothetical protein GCM10011507_24210 [Edaphobacter acidisoli]|uniref:Plasmid stabilization protein n=1 Tax=Edaphobacter acidisoli TaxID=2040573 RepID=A0A916RXK6_9BACT|nr:type II toxin-antitoxin system RelE/ParE family toxin [Edaphobacter acidisoli]GGA71755.1 hypothetical protein GCM10011507_24210 [Edaphobacter acidisoli]